MKRFVFIGFALIVLGRVLHAAPGDSVPDHYIIQVRAGVAPETVAARHGLAPAFAFTKAVNGFAGFVPPGRVRNLQNDPRVISVIVDREVAALGKVDDAAKASSSGGTTGQVVPEGVRRIGAAPGALAYTGSGIGVAVVDTGIDLGHADLNVAGAWFTTYGSSAQDDNAHGTHVSGTIGALNNTIAVVGVAPNVTLYAVKVLNGAGSGTDSTIIAGLEWIAQNAAVVSPPIRVVNMSLGRPGALNDNTALRGAVQTLHAAGITVVVAAGNDCDLEVSQQVPATYPEVLAIASTTAKDGSNQYRFYSGFIKADTASYFTSDGAWDSATKIGVTVSAPGEDQSNITKAGFIKPVGILSTRLGGGTTRMYGTSMASPHAAGVAALLAQKFGTSITPEQVRSKIIAGAGNPLAPLDMPVSCYSFDGDREGVLSAPGALGGP